MALQMIPSEFGFEKVERVLGFHLFYFAGIPMSKIAFLLSERFTFFLNLSKRFE